MSTEQIGRYEIRRELGRGGMATVFAAYDPRFEREVAIKVLPKAFLHDPQFRTRFDREAKTIALLEHPSIVPVYDFGEEDGQPYIVMRMMTGGDLGDRIKKKSLSLDETLLILERLADSLDVAHAKGIIHRDLKPGNILFDQYGNAFLSDFGIARLKESEASLTGSAIIGTPAYMSPEQIQGEARIDGRSDIYAMGVIVFQMLTGQMPYKADTPAKVMMMHILDPIPKITDVRPDLPDALNDVIRKAMAKNPDERYSTMAQMVKDFALAIKGIHPESSVGQAEPKPTLQAAAMPANSLESTAISPTAGVVPQTVRVSTGPAVPPVTANISDTAVAAPEIKPAKKGMGLWLGIIAAFIVVGGGIGAFAIFGRGSNATPEPTLVPTTAVVEVIPPSATLPPATPTPQPTETQAVVVVEPPTSTPSATPEPTFTPTITLEPTATPTKGIPIIGGADKIAYLDDNNIMVANLDGTELEKITTDGQEKFDLSWSVDGTKIFYRSGKCIKYVDYEARNPEPINLACFLYVDYLEGYDISYDGTQLAISLDRQMYIVPMDIPALQAVSKRTDLTNMAVCKDFAPYLRDPVIGVYWSRNGQKMAIEILGVGANELRVELIKIIDITKCTPTPQKFDEFPANRFTIAGYDKDPRLFGVDWDGEFLFIMNSSVRNKGFGDMYFYNTERLRGEKINPIDNGNCCYRDSKWSPDGRYVVFAYQDRSLGADSKTILYYVPFADFNTGLQLLPLNLPVINKADLSPSPALRPAVKP